MKKKLPVILLSAILASCGGGGDTKFSVALFGDSPYGTSPTDTSEFAVFPKLLKSIDADPDVSIALFDGDIHSGKEYCTEAYDQSIASQFIAMVHPLVYTPGDNEWADCHKSGEGGGTWNATTNTATFVVDASGKPVDYASGNPVDNLSLVRKLFFPKPGVALGGGALPVHTQAQEFDPAFPADAQYVENVWFMRNSVLFVAANIPGGSNNGTDPWYGAPSQSAQQVQEVANRSGATTRWLKAAFAQAAAQNASAIVIMVQADMWDVDGKAATHITGYKQYVDVIAGRAASFSKPVLLFNGDSHTYRSDNPLAKASPCLYEPSSGAAAVACTFDAYDAQPYGYNVPNFHRIVTHGSTLPLEWLKLSIDPGATAAASVQSFGPFSWDRVPAQ